MYVANKYMYMLMQYLLTNCKESFKMICTLYTEYSFATWQKDHETVLDLSQNLFID